MPRTATFLTERAFLYAIIEQPDDDIPRLVFADWLEERGDPRGTFIRLQCQRAKLSRHDPHWAELLAQEAALYKQHETEWTASVARHVVALEFRRGFIEHVRIRAGRFLKTADLLFQRAPIRSVELIELNTSAAQLADCPHLLKLTSLGLAHNELGSQWVRSVACSPYVIHLTHLDLYSCGLISMGAEALANAPNLGRLRSLNVGWNYLDEAGAAAIVGAPHLTNLCELNLRVNDLRDASAILIANTRTFQLTHLDLGYTEIGNDGAIALASTSQLGNLRSLKLDGNAISNRGALAIARSPHMSRLEHLDLSSNRINDRGIQALAASTTLPELAYLNVEANEFGPAAAQKLAASNPNFPKMRQLLLGQHGGK